MANIYDMNAAIEKPNVLQSFRQGQQYGMQLRQQQQAQRDEQQLRQLAPQVVGGDPQAYAQAAAIDPQAAGQYDDANVNMAKRAAGAAAYMLDAVKRGNPQEIQGRYNAVLPFLTKLGAAQGKTPPPQFDPAMVPAMEQLVAMSQGMGAQQGTGVQSTYVDRDGNRIAIMRDGTTQNLGPAEQNLRLRDQPGIAPGAFDPRTGRIMPIQEVPPEGFDNGGGATVGDTRVNLGLPPQQQEAVARAVSAMQSAGVDQAVINSFVAAQMPQSVDRPGAQQGGVSSMRPAMTPAQEAAERRASEAAQARTVRTLSPEEVAQRGYRPGSIVQVDGFGQETVKQAPAQDRASMSDAERKAILAAKAKVPQLQNAVRGLTRIDDALQGLEGGFLDTGPVDQYAQRYTKAGQELESAVGAIQNSFLALTRVPGIGAQSDLEARIAALQYPSLDKAPEVNRRTMAQLKFFARDLAEAYRSLLQTEGAEPAPQRRAGEQFSGFRVLED